MTPLCISVNRVSEVLEKAVSVNPISGITNIYYYNYNWQVLM